MSRTTYPDQSGQAEQAGRGISVSSLNQTKAIEILERQKLNVLEALGPPALFILNQLKSKGQIIGCQVWNVLF